MSVDAAARKEAKRKIEDLRRKLMVIEKRFAGEPPGDQGGGDDPRVVMKRLHEKIKKMDVAL